MTEKELREIKRRFRPERSNIPKIVGCFVNENGQILSKISQSIALSDSVVSEKLLAVMKKTLSGSLGTNLTDINFSTKQVTDSEEHKLLMELVKSHLQDGDALDRFYKNVTESVKFDSNYVILLANDIYDVFTHGKDGESSDSTEQFSYVIAAICPVKSLPDALSFKGADSLFHALGGASVLASPELGFMFPAFDDRKTNIYSALYYTRNIAESYSDFTERIFASEPPMPPKTQRLTFNGALSDTLSDECSFEVVRSLHAEIGEMIEAHKESKDPEPLVITKATVKHVLEGCGISEEKLEKLEASFDESFGVGAELTPKNVISQNKFEITTPEVTVKVDPEHRDLISTQVINNVKYVMIRVDGSVEVNGINITIDGE
ncbi:MAG: DUF4317 domain-containing protein [Clostridia bacterium]|nr:DUF4317 domain-containing protein [Clostridia bacterium]